MLSPLNSGYYLYIDLSGLTLGSAINRRQNYIGETSIRLVITFSLSQFYMINYKKNSSSVRMVAQYATIKRDR